jgi:hypothetical protein
MKNPSKNNFQNSVQFEPPKGLKEAVLTRIEKEKMKKMAFKKMWFRLGFAISGIFSILAIFVFGRQLLASEFLSLAFLGFSDMQVMATLWQDYLMSLLETFPTVIVAGTLLPIFVFMLLIQQYAKIEQDSNQYSLKH